MSEDIVRAFALLDDIRLQLEDLIVRRVDICIGTLASSVGICIVGVAPTGAPFVRGIAVRSKRARYVLCRTGSG